VIYRSAAGAAAVELRYRELLRRWPVPHETQTVATREGQTFIVTSGAPDNPPVVALQGSGANTAMWLPQVERLARHLRVYAVDVIGEPGLSAPSRPPLASEAYATWMDDVLAALGLDQTAMLGVSLGGWLALDYATRRAERVTSLALLTPSGIGRPKRGVLLVALALRAFGDRGMRQTMRYALGPAAQGFADAELGAFALLIGKHFRPRTESIPTFSDAALRRLELPLLVVVGGKDAMLDSYETARRLNAAVPQATVHLLPESGHLLPDQAETVLRFLRSAAPATPPSRIYEQ
jgi:pimeloyl-ACP methyl ester carboxylesterase